MWSLPAIGHFRVQSAYSQALNIKCNQNVIVIYWTILLCVIRSVVQLKSIFKIVALTWGGGW